MKNIKHTIYDRLLELNIRMSFNTRALCLMSNYFHVWRRNVGVAIKAKTGDFCAVQRKLGRCRDSVGEDRTRTRPFCLIVYLQDYFLR